MKLAGTLFLLIFTTALANQDIPPALTKDTLIGTWEALPEQNPPLLFHMEINPAGKSYLVQVTVGTSEYIVRPLISTEVNNGHVRLHFAHSPSTQMRGVVHDDVWIVGTGVAMRVAKPAGVEESGVIEGRFCICNEAPPEALTDKDKNIVFIKGVWTHEVSDASRKAEELIRAAASAAPVK